MSETRNTPVQISLTGILADLENGVTRKTSDKGYDPTRGSIEEKYELSKSDVTELFKHPALMGKKVKIPKVVSFVLNDDREPSYGAPSAAGERRLAASAEHEAEAGGSVEGVNTNEEPTLEPSDIEAVTGSDEVVKTTEAAPEGVEF